MLGRQIVLGFDGADFDLIDPWVEQGALPHLAQLMKDGARATLLSTMPPVSPHAWATFQTGVNPGKHGVYGFMESNLHAPPKPTNAFSLGVPPFWKFFNDIGKSVGIVNVFATYPPQPVNGFVIAGRNVLPGKPYMFPSGLADEIEHNVGSYIIDVNPYHGRRKLANISEKNFIELLHKIVKMRIRTFHYLQETYCPDLFVIVFTTTDVVQHFFWRYLDQKHPFYPGPGNTLGHTAIFDIYRLLDDFLGDVMAKMSPEDTLMVVSDHGHGPWYKELSLNRFLIDSGWLVPLNPQRPTQVAKNCMKRLLPSQILKKAQLTYRRYIKWRYKTVYEQQPIEWSQTKAFGKGHYGNICINVKGREPGGIVAPGTEYERVRDAICHDLETWINPLINQPAVKRAWRKEEVYSGHRAEHAPDIVVEWNDYAYVSSHASDFTSPIVHDVHSFYYKLILSGSHRPVCMCVCKGPGIHAGHTASAVNLQDVAPTILHMAGLPIPSYMDGRVMVDLFDSDFKHHPPQIINIEPVQQSGEATQVFSEKETEEISEQLKSLGYMD